MDLSVNPLSIANIYSFFKATSPIHVTANLRLKSSRAYRMEEVYPLIELRLSTTFDLSK